MKILQINSVCGVGSTGRIATDIHKVLIENGHESYIAYGRGEARNCDSTIKIGSRLNNYAHALKSRLLDRHGFGSINATKEFINKIIEFNPDLIHLHNIHGYYLNVELLFDFLKKIEKPVVWTLHDCWAYTGHCAYYDYANCNKWQTGCFNCPQLKTYPKSIMKDNSKLNYLDKKRIFTGIDKLTIITPSKWLADNVKKSFLSGYDIRVINNGIDLNKFKPTENNFKEKYNIKDKFMILGVASIWEKRKGLSYFIDLSKRLTNDEIIVLVGLNDKQIKSLPKNIIGVSKTNNANELVEIYSAADVFFNPTLEDNFPTTNLEALACETPVITFNTGGSIESVDNNCGFIVDQGDLKDVYNKIQILKRGNKEIYKKETIDRAQKLYSAEQKYLEYIELYYKSIIHKVNTIEEDVI